MSPVPASPPTTSTDTQPARTVWSRWNGWFKISLLAALTYGAYIVWVVGRMGHPAHEDPVPRPLNSIALTALSLITVLAFLLGWRLECRARDFRKSQRRAVRDAEEATWRAAVLAAIAEIKNGRSGESTVDLVRQGTRTTVYASASIAALQASQFGFGGDGCATPDTTVDRVVKRVAEQIIDDVREYGRQKWFAGYAHREEDDARGGSVHTLPQRNGHRTTS